MFAPHSHGHTFAHAHALFMPSLYPWPSTCVRPCCACDPVFPPTLPMLTPLSSFNLAHAQALVSTHIQVRLVQPMLLDLAAIKLAARDAARKAFFKGGCAILSVWVGTEFGGSMAHRHIGGCAWGCTEHVCSPQAFGIERKTSHMCPARLRMGARSIGMQAKVTSAVGNKWPAKACGMHLRQCMRMHRAWVPNRVVCMACVHHICATHNLHVCT